MSVVDDILENARRLRDDARLLFNAKQYASCGLLQVICLEELGKAYLVAQNIESDKHRYHYQKQEAAISLSAAVRMHRLFEETCEENDWDFWGNTEDAEKYCEWMMSEDGRKAIGEATNMVGSWLHVTRRGMLEKIRLVAAYIDDGPNPAGQQVEEGSFYTYKSFGKKFTDRLFEFIGAGFECLDDNRMRMLVEIFRTTWWKTTIQ